MPRDAADQPDRSRGVLAWWRDEPRSLVNYSG